MVHPFLLWTQLYSVEEEKGRISFLPGGNGVLLLSNGILRNAHNSNNNSEEDIERLPGLCFECPNCLMLKDMVIRKNPADAFIKLAPSSQIGKSKVKANQIISHSKYLSSDLPYQLLWCCRLCFVFFFLLKWMNQKAQQNCTVCDSTNERKVTGGFLLDIKRTLSNF